MDNAIRLGYQAAVVSLKSPTYGRLWLSVKLHPGNVLSCQVAEEMVLAAEGQTGVRPRRRTELLGLRLHAVSQERAQVEQRLQQRCQASSAAQALMQARSQQVGQANAALTDLIADSEPAAPRKERPHGRLAQARAHLATCERRLQRQQQRFLQAQRSAERQEVRLAVLRATEQTLRQRLERFNRENAANPAPIQAVFRLDAGFGTWENVALLIELGYEVYTRPYSQQVKASLLHRIEGTTPRVRVGANAEMSAWSGVLFKGSPYLVDVALEHFYTGKTEQYGALLHFGADAVTKDLYARFAFRIAPRRSRRASKKVREYSRCTISRCVPCRRSGCKNSSPPLRPTSCAGPRIGCAIIAHRCLISGSHRSQRASRLWCRSPLTRLPVSSGCPTVAC